MKGSSSTDLFVPFNNVLHLSVYSDAYCAAYVDSRRSLTGYCIFFVSTPISWNTKKQTTVSRSTKEAEYCCIVEASCELTWVSFVLQDLLIPLNTPVPFYCNNKTALHITENPIFHERTKHIEIDCHIVRDKYKGLIKPMHLSSKIQLADLLTKALTATQPPDSTRLIELDRKQ
ncbi:UNVERIFIED_CONTAM: Retrovirus-related Pol polyprotein from transposon RE1 [Sesamum indicum]